MKLVPTATTIEIVNESSILYIESYQNYTKLYLSGGKIIISRLSLTSFAKDEDPLFCRIHLSYIINLRKVQRYHRNGNVELNEEINLPVSRRKRTSFLEKLQHAVDADLI